MIERTRPDAQCETGGRFPVSAKNAAPATVAGDLHPGNWTAVNEKTLVGPAVGQPGELAMKRSRFSEQQIAFIRKCCQQGVTFENPGQDCEKQSSLPRQVAHCGRRFLDPVTQFLELVRTEDDVDVVLACACSEGHHRCTAIHGR